MELEGVRIIDLTTHADSRGSFTETFRRAWLPDDAPPMIQSNLSVSHAGVLRGIHFHRSQADFWVFLEGRAFIALIDLRTGSPTERARQTLRVDAAEGRRGIYLPPGVAHGFLALTDAWLQYMVDAYYTGDDEQGFAWDDPDAGVPWPTDGPVLSERDAIAPPLADVLGQAPAYGAQP
ncbi:MAG: dTDP-4-dehydrorhamnose 3,5-epimerase family protein [Actinomycetota bacterium]